MFKLKKYSYSVRAFGAGVALVLFLMVTNPHDVSLGFLVLPILMISLITYFVAMQVLIAFNPSKQNPKRKRAVSFIISLAVGFLLMLQSIDQLQAGDVAIILVIAMVAGFYSSRFR